MYLCFYYINFWKHWSFLSVKFGLSHFCLDIFWIWLCPKLFLKKKLQVADSTLVNFFEMHLNQHFYFFWKWKKKIFQKKNTSVGSKHQSNPTLAIFFWNNFFFISKKITSVGLSAFQKNLQVLNQPLVIFFFRKSLEHSQIYKISRQKWLSPKLDT